MTEGANRFDGDVSGNVVMAGHIHGDVNISSASPVPEALAGLPADEGFTGRADLVSELGRVLAARDQNPVLVCSVAGTAGVGKTGGMNRALTCRVERFANAR